MSQVMSTNLTLENEVEVMLRGFGTIPGVVEDLSSKFCRIRSTVGGIGCGEYFYCFDPTQYVESQGGRVYVDVWKFHSPVDDAGFQRIQQIHAQAEAEMEQIVNSFSAVS